jgi:hypothetical protein
VRLHFETRVEIGFGEIAGQPILNLDETGFGASKSGRAKSGKVIISTECRTKPVFKESVDSLFVTALCPISAAGDVLTPKRITNP